MPGHVKLPSRLLRFGDCSGRASPRRFALGVTDADLFWAPSLVDDEPSRDAYPRLSRSSVSPGSARALMQLGYQVNWEAVLPAIRVPTLVLHRTGDLVVPVRQGRELAEGIPQARFVELTGVDHLMWAGDQHAIVEEVRRFLADITPPRLEPGPRDDPVHGHRRIDRGPCQDGRPGMA